LVGKPEGKRRLIRPRHRWEDNINIHLQEEGYEGVERIDLAQDKGSWMALVDAEMEFRIP
jgi:hypothetical protein